MTTEITNAELDAALEEIRQEQKAWFAANRKKKTGLPKASKPVVPAVSESRLKAVIAIGKYLAEQGGKNRAATR